MNIAIDTNILSKICYPAPESNRIVVNKFKEIISSGQFRVLIPEICVYELKRSLLLNQLNLKEPGSKSLARLQELLSAFEMITMDSSDFNLAADLWAQARASGFSTAGDKALDADVLLAAQAIKASCVVITENIKHLQRYTTAKTIFEIKI